MATTIQIDEKTLLLLKKIKEELNAKSYNAAIKEIVIERTGKESMAGSLNKYYKNKTTLQLIKELQKKGERVTDSKILDSSIWIAFIAKNNCLEIINSSDTLMISALSLFEIKRKFIKDKIPSIEIEKNIEFIKKRCIILPIDEKTAEKAAELSIHKNLPAIDSLIYSTSILNNSKLFTLDNDFRNLENVQIISI